MKHLKEATLAISAGILLASCSQELIPDYEETNQPDRISELIGNFYQKVHNDTRTNGSGFTITDISTKTYSLPDSVKSATRSEGIPENYDIQTVTVNFGETTGYVILSDTPELDQIFYYTEAGCINDTTEITPLKDLVENIPNIATSILIDNTTSEYTRGTEINIQPLVRFEWDQRPPFNNYAAYCTCEKCSLYGNHMPIGCVTIAVGQTIATLKKFNGTFYGNRDIDFDTFPNRGSQFTPSQSMGVAHFLQEIALTCQIKFGCDGSGTTLLAAARCLLDHGYKCDVIKGDLDKNRYIMNLQEGLPHLMRGASNDGGHMWILDGLVETDNNCMFHINWGWGYSKSSGWASDKYYVTNSGSSFGKNMQHLYLGGVRSN